LLAAVVAFKPSCSFILLGYSAFRIFEESVRIDYSVYILGMRLNFWIALAGTLGGLIWFAAVQRRARSQLQSV
jgi:prolipoprotein diacylglyceryltransferase